MHLSYTYFSFLLLFADFYCVFSIFIYTLTALFIRCRWYEQRWQFCFFMGLHSFRGKLSSLFFINVLYVLFAWKPFYLITPKCTHTFFVKPCVHTGAAMQTVHITLFRLIIANCKTIASVMLGTKRIFFHWKVNKGSSKFLTRHIMLTNDYSTKWMIVWVDVQKVYNLLNKKAVCIVCRRNCNVTLFLK